MSEFGVEELGWAAQSPDLNPIDHLWGELERRLQARPPQPNSVSDLRNVVLEGFKLIRNSSSYVCEFREANTFGSIVYNSYFLTLLNSYF